MLGNLFHNKTANTSSGYHYHLDNSQAVDTKPMILIIWETEVQLSKVQALLDYREFRVSLGNLVRLPQMKILKRLDMEIIDRNCLVCMGL